MAYGGWLGLGWVVRLRVSEAFGFCIRDALKKNKYGTRTGVAELMCEQLGGDCSRKRLYIVCIFFQIGVFWNFQSVNTFISSVLG